MSVFKYELLELIPLIFSLSVGIMELLFEVLNYIQGMIKTTYSIISIINPYEIGKSLGLLTRPYGF